MSDTIARPWLAQPGDPPPRPGLSGAGILRLDQAELFILSLDTEMLTTDGLRAAYLLGLAEIHLAGLIELIAAVTRRSASP